MWNQLHRVTSRRQIHPHLQLLPGVIGPQQPIGRWDTREEPHLGVHGDRSCLSSSSDHWPPTHPHPPAPLALLSCCFLSVFCTSMECASKGTSGKWTAINCLCLEFLQHRFPKMTGAESSILRHENSKRTKQHSHVAHQCEQHGRAVGTLTSKDDTKPQVHKNHVGDW